MIRKNQTAWMYLKEMNRALCVLLFLAGIPHAFAQYADWKHSGSIYILTTPEGADLPASACVKNFPSLVRLHRDHFRFSRAEEGGSDIRFSGGGQPLSYEIEEWDKEAGAASIWVRIPSIRGNDRQEIKIHWGKAGSPNASDGKAVFNASNGYIGVWQLDSDVRDVVGRLESEDKGTTKAEGVIGGARHFPGKMGVFCGKDIKTLPSGGAPHSTQAWFQPETSNGRIVAWGNEKGQGKVTMSYRSPPRIRMDCYFSNGDVRAEIPGRAKGWTRAAHTFEEGQAILYINGEKRGAGNPRHTQLAIERPARMWIGGWYAIALQLDQPVVWKDSLVNEFRLDGAKGKVTSGDVSGNVLTLKLKEPSRAGKITYLDETAWSQDRLLVGKNGIAALTFCNVPVLDERKTK